MILCGTWHHRHLLAVTFECSAVWDDQNKYLEGIPSNIKDLINLPNLPYALYEGFSRGFQMRICMTALHSSFPQGLETPNNYVHMALLLVTRTPTTERRHQPMKPQGSGGRSVEKPVRSGAVSAVKDDHLADRPEPGRTTGDDFVLQRTCNRSYEPDEERRRWVELISKRGRAAEGPGPLSQTPTKAGGWEGALEAASDGAGGDDDDSTPRRRRWDPRRRDETEALQRHRIGRIRERSGAKGTDGQSVGRTTGSYHADREGDYPSVYAASRWDSRRSEHRGDERAPCKRRVDDGKWTGSKYMKDLATEREKRGSDLEETILG
ncbi:hypothetical protein HPB50_022559 [Hyalomma asiaticum]|uniref:Uncharacterized protein n=1 Tax=Hyalomma asiaticum TaxID=266040 RepID=A0ACB7RW43_HYAAI|nr:hypothetical protein HPB50_022559 [Hyalomma asiaticum]